MPGSRHRQYTKGSHFTSGHIDTDKCSRRDQNRVPALHYDCAQYSRLPRSRTMVQCYIMYARVSGITGSHVLQHRTVRCTISFNAIVLCRLCSTAMDGWIEANKQGPEQTSGNGAEARAMPTRKVTGRFIRMPTE
ncbi:hypothetical protein FOTG_07962 [Fusarium oxysporum f. sp. vasinfectum 25433]|uniref:Uncharacterized protein n=1 Tax=Fusarium oxysporum f. sp. vasinfectum 25433 TaxID=1089449 RepID=X0LUQ2_FUSOX|nr:hypothetical protein FOTG_07962 [Fusarium oxysporum f. sp. vasinfectum 25433]EXM24933.1 hypothetical protein FOTG_07962 [Fusarium oxysporum f. sp. vasinfectum 25433]EXM24934.1 hypothetical protein FOTG_07962 [Fusarium oxysporum f. sp. vasinfectum 25433]EXM24935.1 hypothetical protein FOTG_07962 [Fusarium oxysporum f. sp. vasinfectum 25433]EXM24936.1 hypothetical protein FOTG_07962 [Fusarium oxysporum f. sp. vasinfectum 25433]